MLSRDIDVTMTACLRCAILEQTLGSFFKYLKGFKSLCPRLIINIDPVGPDNYTDVLGVCRQYFDKIVSRVSDNCSFSYAFKWVWGQVEAPFVLHLEDDWVLTKNVSVTELLDTLEEEQDLMILRLAAFAAGPKYMKNWNKFFPYDGNIYRCPSDLKGGLAFCGHPSVIKKSFIEFMAPLLDPTRNPEKQIKHNAPKIGKILRPFLNKYEYGVYSKPDNDPLVIDIGRQWMIANGYSKKGSKAFFTEWEKRNGCI